MTKEQDQQIKRILNKIKKINIEIERLKELYEDRSDLIDQLRSLKFKGNSEYEIIDRFSKKQVFTTTSVRRYELKEKK